MSSLGRQLLDAIRAVMNEKSLDAIPSVTLVAALVERGEPWSSFFLAGRGMTMYPGRDASMLASILRQYGIAPIRLPEGAKGYRRAMFEEAWESALPPLDGESSEIARLAREIKERTLLEWVPLEKIFADRYTRPVNQRSVEQMAREWDLNRTGTVYLSYRDEDRYAVLDGMHRISAARIKGEKELPARVYLYLSYQTEAGLYVYFARHRPQTALDRFLANLEAGDARTVEIIKILMLFGLEVDRPPADNHVRAASALELVYSRYGPGILRGTMAILHGAFACQARAYSHLAIEGTAAFWARYCNEADRGQVVDRLKKSGLEMLYQHAQSKRVIVIQTATLFGQAIRDVYNRGRKRRLSPWEDATPAKGGGIDSVAVPPPMAAKP